MIKAPSLACAAITGAAGGLGQSFSRHLALRGYNLLLIDRDAEHLEELAERWRAEFPVEIETLPTDLTEREAVARLADRLHEEPQLETLVNNAGFGHLTEFCNASLRTHQDMLAVHAQAPMQLIHAVLPQMKARRRGAIINVASLGAFVPSAKSVQYAATKAYLVVLSEALQEELLGSGVRIQALCPGFVRTGFHLQVGMRSFATEHERSIPSHFWMHPDQVAEYSLRSLDSGKVIVIPGWKFRTLGLLLRMPLLQPLMRRMSRPASVRQMPQPLAPSGALE